MKAYGVGLGLRVEAEYDPGLEVRWVVPESPAEKAGIQPGDMLLAVNGKDILIKDELRGEQGSTVSMMILSLFGELLCLELERTVREGQEEDPEVLKDVKAVHGSDGQQSTLPEPTQNQQKEQARLIAAEIMERQAKQDHARPTVEGPNTNTIDRAKNTYRLPKFAQLTREEPKVAYCINRTGSGSHELVGTPLESSEFPTSNKLQIGDIVWFSDYHEQTRLASIIDINTIRSPEVYILELAATMESGGRLVLDIAAYDQAVGAVHAGTAGLTGTGQPVGPADHSVDDDNGVLISVSPTSIRGRRNLDELVMTPTSKQSRRRARAPLLSRAIEQTLGDGEGSSWLRTPEFSEASSQSSQSSDDESELELPLLKHYFSAVGDKQGMETLASLCAGAELSDTTADLADRLRQCLRRMQKAAPIHLPQLSSITPRKQEPPLTQNTMDASPSSSDSEDLREEHQRLKEQMDEIRRRAIQKDVQTAAALIRLDARRTSPGPPDWESRLLPVSPRILAAMTGTAAGSPTMPQGLPHGYYHYTPPHAMPPPGYFSPTNPFNTPGEEESSARRQLLPDTAPSASGGLTQSPNQSLNNSLNQSLNQHLNQSVSRDSAPLLPGPGPARQVAHPEPQESVPEGSVVCWCCLVPKTAQSTKR